MARSSISAWQQLEEMIAIYHVFDLKLKDKKKKLIFIFKFYEWNSRNSLVNQNN